MIENERILVTGGAGFIGLRLAERLSERNEVVVFDTFARSPVEACPLSGRPNVRLLAGDVRDADAVAGAAAGCHRVVHLASIAGVGTVLSNPTRTLDVALSGTRNVLEAARRAGGCRRVVTFSTSEVYGRYAMNASESEVTPIGPVGEPRWSYAVAKVATEHLAHAYFTEFGLPTASLRPFNVYGPGQVGEGAIHNFVRDILAGRAITVNNDGRQIRAWCYLDDMVDGTLLALEQDAAIGQAFNIGNPAATITVLRLAELLARLAGVSVDIAFRRRDYPDVEVRVPNIDKARDLLGFEPKVRLETGLATTLDWYRREHADGHAS